ncbi:MAG: curved DNA-binding protein CbpA [Lentimonas sp.]|jgi:curved DNA-binding protein CbpA
MKRINEYKKMFEIDKAIDLKELKSTYRKLVKKWHPDKFLDDDPQKEEAVDMGRRVVDGYHFLVSIAPETVEANRPEYEKMIAECGIKEMNHKGLLMTLTFTDGSRYDYFGVNAALFRKFLNSDKQVRFAKRFIFTSFIYRKSQKAAEQE